MTGAPRAPSRAFWTYAMDRPSGDQTGSWWPSGSFSGALILVSWSVARSRTWRTTSDLEGSGPSVTSATRVPSGRARAGQRPPGFAAAGGVEAHQGRRREPESAGGAVDPPETGLGRGPD